MSDTRRKLRLYGASPSIQVMTGAALLGAGLLLGHRDAPWPGLVATGWVLYLAQEHLVHRFIFHAPAPRTQRWFDLLYRLHYGHHDQVWNRHLLFTPLWFAGPLAVANTLALASVLPWNQAAIAVLAGGVPAYLLFEWIHLTSHFRASSKGRLARYVTRRHGQHHFIDHTNWYTVSPGGQLFDKALGADPSEPRVVANPRTCGLVPDDPRLVLSRRRFGLDRSLDPFPVPHRPAEPELAS